MLKTSLSRLFLFGLFGASLVLVASFVMTASAQAQVPKLLREYQDWTAYAFNDAKTGKTCFMTSTPLKMAPTKVKHGDVYAMVTHRPKAKIRNEVSLTVGFPFKARSEVRISVGKKPFKMYTSVDTAWSYEEKDDRKLVAAMRAGDDMKVQGMSKRGTRVSYRFSLSGFTKAYQLISRACKKKK